MAKKRYDPLWEIVGEKVALQGEEPYIDVACPHCHVTARLGPAAKVGWRYACGLCGGVLEVMQGPNRLELAPVDAE